MDMQSLTNELYRLFGRCMISCTVFPSLFNANRALAVADVLVFSCFEYLTELQQDFVTDSVLSLAKFAR